MGKSRKGPVETYCLFGLGSLPAFTSQPRVGVPDRPQGGKKQKQKHDPTARERVSWNDQWELEVCRQVRLDCLISSSARCCEMVLLRKWCCCRLALLRSGVPPELRS